MLYRWSFSFVMLYLDDIFYGVWCGIDYYYILIGVWVVGMCFNVGVVLWYFGFLRYEYMECLYGV